ncbi:MAG: hypothetical protein ACO4B4_09955 [Planctomycetota bacterium]
MQKIRRRKFGEILVAEGIISRESLRSALERQRGTGLTVGELLLQEGVIAESDIVRCICSQYQLPFIRPSAYEASSKLLDEFGADFLFKNKVVPLDRIGSCVILAVAEIPEERVERAIIDKCGCDIYYYVSPITDVENTLRIHFQLGQEKMLALNELRRSERARGQLESPPPSFGSTGDHATAVVTGSARGPSPVLESLDSSWESIFDEAEQNLSEQGVPEKSEES